MNDEMLRGFAEDAFDVLNLARRMGFKRDAQVEQVVAAFRKRLGQAESGTAADAEVVPVLSVRFRASKEDIQAALRDRRGDR